MTTPYDARFAASLQGGVRDDIALGVVDADTTALTAAQGQAMSAENDRRMLAAQRPGHGTEMHLEQPPGGPGVGISDVPLPVAGMGYDVAPEASEAQVTAYSTPDYAPDAVGGFGFTAGRQEPPIRRHVHDAGDFLLVEPGHIGGPGSAGAPVIVSPPAPRPGLLARAAAGMRRLLGRQ